jgi:seryl-tRNA synthetase
MPCYEAPETARSAPLAPAKPLPPGGPAQVVAERQLPIKLVGFGHCFRTEAGSAGAAGAATAL